ncbi:MAG: type III-A CRISPR-associated RAMP protein Csm3 [bacterium]
MKLKGYKRIEGIIEVITGLHIGGSTTIIEIGGKDNPVIKHPITKEPYIPGSSLKGKMRSLLEWKIDKKLEENGEVHKWCEDPKCPICVIFGTSAEDAGIGPTRLIVRDAVLDEKYKDEQKRKDTSWSPLYLTEDKYENTINRITARANPRNFERVISGVKFALDMSYRVFENSDKGNNDENLFKYVLEGMRLIEKDALGGAGSRGCGQVKFKIRINGDLTSLDQIKETDIKTEYENSSGQI